ncbi:MAG: hypothetical protein ACOX5G_07250 [Kiritimatiellia bacterium]|jgi:hypothetical protein
MTSRPIPLCALLLLAASRAPAQLSFSSGGYSRLEHGAVIGPGETTRIPGGTILRHEAPLPPPAFSPDDPLQMATLDIRPFESDTQGLLGRLALPRGTQQLGVYAGRLDGRRHRALIDLRQELAEIDAALRRDTAPVEFEGLPHVEVTPNRVKIHRSTEVERSGRNQEASRRHAAERARARIDRFLKTLDWRIAPAEDGTFACAPIPPGRYLLFAAARVPDETDRRNLAPSRHLYWVGFFDYADGRPLAVRLGEGNGSDWRALFRFAD